MSLSLLLALTAALALSASAQAAAPVFSSSFTGADITPTPTQPFQPGPSAIDESSAEVYVFDKANQAIHRFTAAGAYVPGSTNNGSGTTTGSFGLSGLGGLAVDQSSGNLYLAAENQNTVYAFDQTGAFLWQIDSTNFPPAASWGICGIAVDSEGHIWVSDFGGSEAEGQNGIVRRFAATGSPPAQTGYADTTARGNPCRIAFDSQDSLYVSYYNGGVDRYPKNPTPADPAEPYDLPPVAVQTASNPSSAVAVDLSTDDVYIDNGTEVAAFSSTGVPLSGTPFGSGTLVASDNVSINGSTGQIYLSDPGDLDEGRGTVDIFNTGSAVPKQPLEVTRTGAGTGTVTSSPSGIDCGSTCANEFDESSTVTLSASADERSTFDGWTGCDAEPSASECEVTMSAAKSVSADFSAIPQQTLTVTRTGSGEGAVTGTSPGEEFTAIDCGGTCEAEYNEGATITLTAAAAKHSEFTAWTGCDAEPSASECEVTMSAAKSVEADFAAIPQKELTVELTGSGAGSVVNTTPGFVEINCSNRSVEAEESSICSLGFDEGVVVTLIAIPSERSTFGAWTACPVETEVFGFPACEVTMSEDATVGAEFEAIPQQTLTVTRTGSGEGTVTGTSPGEEFTAIDCGSTCEAEYNEGAAITLTASPEPHSEFTAWTGCDAEPSPSECEVTMSAAKSVEADFAAIPQKELTVELTGSGAGSVVNTTPGFFEIDCSNESTEAEESSTCSLGFDEGAVVTLVALAAEHNHFVAWTTCPNEVTVFEQFPGCEITMSADTTIQAEFEPITHNVSVSVSGQGSVSADSGPISGCTSSAGTCEGPYDEASSVTLTATPDPHQQFTGWSGGSCSGTGTCEVEVEADTNVSATFAPITHTLAVTRAGTGSGSVTSAPPGIDCGATCSAPFDEASTVTLTAAAAANSSFTGWSGADAGACTTASTCEVAIGTGNAAITATFARDKPVVSGETASAIGQHAATLSGKVNPNGAATTCEFEYGTTAAYGTKVPCTANPGAGTSPVSVTVPALSGLSANTTYHYRVNATNTGGTTNGADQTFTTLADTCETNAALCPAPPPPAAAPPAATPPSNPPTNPAAYRVCTKKAAKAYRKALKAAKRKQGKAKGKAIKAAKAKKKKAIKKCAGRHL